MNGHSPDNHRVRPTGRMIVYHLAELTLRTGNATDPPTVRTTRGVPLHLLDLLDADIGHTCWPQTCDRVLPWAGRDLAGQGTGRLPQGLRQAAPLLVAFRPAVLNADARQGCAYP